MYVIYCQSIKFDFDVVKLEIYFKN